MEHTFIVCDCDTEVYFKYSSGLAVCPNCGTCLEALLLDKAEMLTESVLCDVKCLCPSLKNDGFCSDCQVFYSLRDYYIDELKDDLMCIL